MVNLRIYQRKASPHSPMTSSVAVSTKSPSFARPTACSCNMAGSLSCLNHTPFRKKTKMPSLRIRRVATLARAALKTKKLPTGSRTPWSVRSLVLWARQRSQLYMLHLWTRFPPLLALAKLPPFTINLRQNGFIVLSARGISQCIRLRALVQFAISLIPTLTASIFLGYIQCIREVLRKLVCFPLFLPHECREHERELAHWLVFSSTNDTLRLYDERDAKDREGKKYLDASLCIHEKWRSHWGTSRCIGVCWGHRT
jgi:hypothetical protein